MIRSTLCPAILAVACAMALAGCASLTPGGARDGVLVANYVDGETLSYPVVRLAGTLEDPTAERIEVVNRSSKRDTAVIEGVASGGRFIGLAELVPGENRLEVRAGRARGRLTLTYAPSTSPWIVRAIYMTPSDGDTAYQTPLEGDAQDFAGKFGTAMKLFQSLSAEWMHEAGFGRRTFNLEFDEAGDVVVHVLQGREAAESYYADPRGWYGKVWRETKDAYPVDTARNVVIASYTRFDPAERKVQGHTALGSDGGLALFGSAGMYTWPASLHDVFGAFSDTTKVDPSRVHDDSAFRRTHWGMAATTIGAVCHEAGHTFGLPHTPDQRAIMSRGFDRLNRPFSFEETPANNRRTEFGPDTYPRWSDAHAAFLRWNRFFAGDQEEPEDGPGIRVRVDRGADSVTIESPAGIRFVGYGGSEGYADFDSWNGPADPPTRLVVPVDEVVRRGRIEKFRVAAIDGNGRYAVHQER